MSETRSWSRVDLEACREYVEREQRAKRLLQPWMFKPQQAAAGVFGFKVHMRQEHYLRIRRALVPCAIAAALLTADLAHAGVHIGPVDCIPTLELSGSYDDNVFLRGRGDPDRPVEDDGIGRVRPGIRLVYPSASGDTELDYSTEFVVYREWSELNAYGRDHLIRLYATRRIVPRLRLAVADDARVGTDVRGIYGGALDWYSPGIIPASRSFVVNGTQLECGYALTRRWDLDGMLRYGYRRFGDVSDGAVRQESVEAVPVVREHLWDGSVSASFAWHHTNSLRLSLGISYYEYDERGPDWVYSISCGDEWRLTPEFTLSVRAGVGFLTQNNVPSDDDPRDDEGVHPLAELTARYDVAHVRMSASMAYGLGGSSGLGGTVETRSVTIGVEYIGWGSAICALNGRLYQSLSAEDMDQENLDIVNYQLGVSAQYEWYKWLSTRIEYMYIEQRSGDNEEGPIGGSYRDNRVVLCVIASLPDIP